MKSINFWRHPLTSHNALIKGKNRGFFPKFRFRRNHGSEDENLDIPNIAILFKTLTSLGYDCTDIPLSMDAVLEKFKTRR